MAQIALQNARDAWEKYGFGRVDPAAVANRRLAAENAAKSLQQAVERFDILRKESRKLESQTRRLRSLLFLKWWENPYARTVLVIAFLLSGVANGVFVRLMWSAALGWLIGTVMFSFAGLVVAAWFSTSEGIAADTIKSTAAALAQAEEDCRFAASGVATAHQVVESIDAQFQAAKEALRKIRLLSKCADDYEAAKAHYQRLSDIVNSETYKLLHSNWRDLRSVDFEQFLKRVFEALGYSVETTKMSNDMGLDLVVVGKGKRIGVQAKGYKDAAGIDAIQEAHTGMVVYQCDCCVAITNSTFTRLAKEVAKQVGCRLIDGAEMPRLISGEIVF